MNSNRSITGAILQNGRFYKKGDEDALAKVLPQSDIDRHVATGQLTGDWGASAPEATTADTPPAVDPAAAPVEPSPPPAAPPEPAPTAPTNQSAATPANAPSGSAKKPSTTKGK